MELGLIGGIGRFARIGHGLKRLVVVGSDGMISFAALRWLADQNASFVMLERDGSVLATTGPVRSSDARLRRAQALAVNNHTALQLAIRLIAQKLAGQEEVARERLRDSAVADDIAKFRNSLKRLSVLKLCLASRRTQRQRTGLPGRSFPFNIRAQISFEYLNTGKSSVRVCRH